MRVGPAPSSLNLKPTSADFVSTGTIPLRMTVCDVLSRAVIVTLTGVPASGELFELSTVDRRRRPFSELPGGAAKVVAPGGSSLAVGAGMGEGVADDGLPVALAGEGL